MTFDPGTMVAGGLSFLGQERTNSSNEMMAREAMQFNAHEASKNRDFQERMSNTQYQRGVADMKAAGLNPINVAGGGAAASSPSGSSASGTPSRNENSIARGVESALAYKQMTASVDQLTAQTAKTGADTVKAVEDTNVSKEVAKTEKTKQAVNLAQAAAIPQSAKASSAQAMKTAIETQLKELEFPGAQSEARFQSKYGDTTRAFDAILNRALDAVSGATALGRFFRGRPSTPGLSKDEKTVLDSYRRGSYGRGKK